ncbi:MAG: indole-3-glycerol-phosphate synthase TrpC, partial [Thermomicrobiaceae bacterium]|nr:indole-3-glycerol-phosphate synthase TrpC [Thermomicrobiaceae bacterium]
MTALTGTFLDRIVARTRDDLAERKARAPRAARAARAAARPAAIPFARA